jgi:putative membrane protein
MLPFAVLVLVLAGAAHAAPNDKTDNRTLTEPAAKAPAKSLSNDDRGFIAKAAEGDMAEIAEGRIAQQNGQSPKVKDFGGRMVHDHTSINDNLQRIASNKGVSLPDKLDSSGEKGIDKLQGLSGTKFDKAYSKQQVSDHKKAIKAFEKEAKSGSDSDLKTFARDTVPTLKEHLKLAQSAQSAAKSDDTSPGKPKNEPDKKSRGKSQNEPDRKSQG